MYVKSKYPKVEVINEIPVLGSFALIIFSALPGAFLALTDSFVYPIEEETFQYIAFPSFVIWNLLLQKFGIKIYIFLIPAWLFWIIMGVTTLVFKIEF